MRKVSTLGTKVGASTLTRRMMASSTFSSSARICDGVIAGSSLVATLREGGFRRSKMMPSGWENGLRRILGQVRARLGQQFGWHRGIRSQAIEDILGVIAPDHFVVLAVGKTVQIHVHHQLVLPARIGKPASGLGFDFPHQVSPERRGAGGRGWAVALAKGKRAVGLNGFPDDIDQLVVVHFTQGKAAQVRLADKGSQAHRRPPVHAIERPQGFPLGQFVPAFLAPEPRGLEPGGQNDRSLRFPEGR